jgi:hypothetical protein
MVCRRRRHISLLAAAVLSGLPLFARAQYPADNQVGQVDTRVGGELYGNEGDRKGNANYQLRLLPSEERFARWRSGMLPSEYEMNRAAQGPLTPNGDIDYITRQSPLQQAMRLPNPQLINPAYDPDRRRLQRFGMPPAVGGYPQNAMQGVYATTRKPGAPAARPQPQRRQEVAGQQPTPMPQTNTPRDWALPSLTPAPERPIPNGQLPDDLKYDPNATIGAQLLSKSPLQQQQQAPRATPKPPSLSDQQQPKE